jgi:uncharacterized protein (DUF2267 family)
LIGRLPLKLFWGVFTRLRWVTSPTIFERQSHRKRLLSISERERQLQSVKRGGTLCEGDEIMSAAALDVFETTVQKTNRWLNELMLILAWNDKHKTYLALRAVLHALRDRLTVEEVAQLGSQLPMLIRGFYYEGWDPTGKPSKLRHKEQFLAWIEEELSDDERGNAERIARAVFALLAKCISKGEIDDVRATLPIEIRDLWAES